MKFIKFIVRLVIDFFFGVKETVILSDVPDIPMVEKRVESVGERTIHIVDLCYDLIRPTLQRQISKATIASIFRVLCII